MSRSAPRRWLAAAAIVGLLAVAVGVAISTSATARPTAARRGKPQLAERQILRIAMTAAANAGDPKPILIQHSEGTREQANLVDSGDVVPGQQWSYLIAERGHFVFKGVGPSGARAPTGSVMTLVVNARTGQITDSGLSNRYPDLAKLGRVRTDLGWTGYPPPRHGPPTIDPAVAAELSVFRRAQTSADRLLATFRAQLQTEYASARPDIADARRVKASDRQTAYLVPAKEGVCVINTNEAFCSPAASLAGADAVDLCSPTLPNGQLEIEWLLPDGATNVAVGTADGMEKGFAPGFNVYIARRPLSGSLPKTIEWDAGGLHHSVSAGVPSDARSEKCAHPSDLPPASQRPRTPYSVLIGPRPGP